MHFLLSLPIIMDISCLGCEWSSSRVEILRYMDEPEKDLVCHLTAFHRKLAPLALDHIGTRPFFKG